MNSATANHPPIIARFRDFLSLKERRNWKNERFYRGEDIRSWMNSKAKASDSFTNSGALLLAVYEKEKFTPIETKHIAEGHLKVFAVLLHPEVDCGHCIHIFRRRNITDSSLDHEDLKSSFDHIIQDLQRERLLPPSPGLKYGSVYDEKIAAFDRLRWAFCAPTLDSLSQGKTFRSNTLILPFIFQDDINDKGGTATVVQYRIQEDLIGTQDLQKKLHSSKIKDQKHGWCYDIAVKLYRQGLDTIFDAENEAFRALQSQDGVVQYIGNYAFQAASDTQTDHHIILEYGEHDLDEYLAVTYPPVYHTEIVSFWESLFEVVGALKRLHNFKHLREDQKTRDFRGWHGDIKPDNVLRVNGKYKLADFGFAKFENDGVGQDKTYLLGGTRTYGAPECDEKRIKGRTTRTPHLQTIDTWSLGCLFSAVATWVVLGSQAYDNYRKVRIDAIKELRDKQQKDPNISIPSCDDAFHDGKSVLPVVLKWHNFLRNSERKADTITHRVLNLVERSMLLENPKARSPIARVYEELEDIVVSARARYQKSVADQEIPEVAPDILLSLLKLDEDAPATAGARSMITSSHSTKSQMDTTSHKHTVSGQQDQRQQPPISNRRGKSELLDKVVFGKTANREKAIKDDLGLYKQPSLQRISEVPEMCDSPKALPHDTDSSPPRDIPRFTVTSGSPDKFDQGKGLGISGDHLAAKNSSVVSQEASYMPSIFDVGHHQNKSSRPLPFQPVSIEPFLHPNLTRQQPDVQQPSPVSRGPLEGNVSAPMTPKRQIPTITSAQLPASPPGGQMQSAPQQNAPSLPPSPGATPQKDSRMHQSDCEENSEILESPSRLLSQELRYAIFDEYEKQKTLWGEKVPFAKLRGKIPVDPYLKTFIRNRDVKFVVDNAASMKQHSMSVKMTLLALAMKIGPLDTDGLDLIYTMGNEYNLSDVKDYDIHKKFEDSINRAYNAIDGRFKTNMTATLSVLFDDYKNYGKKQTLVILTDGLWQGSQSTTDVEGLISGFVDGLRAKLNKLERRWFTIQFISFGNDERALRRLELLDDKLGSKEDVVDAKPWTYPDVNKLILGSITDDGDNDDKPSPSSSGVALGSLTPQPRPENTPTIKRDRSKRSLNPFKKAK